MAKLTSSTEKTKVDISPDKSSIIFQSVEQGHQIWWPTKDWQDLKDFIDRRLGQGE